MSSMCGASSAPRVGKTRLARSARREQCSVGVARSACRVGRVARSANAVTNFDLALPSNPKFSNGATRQRYAPSGALRATQAEREPSGSRAGTEEPIPYPLDHFRNAANGWDGLRSGGAAHELCCGEALTTSVEWTLSGRARLESILLRCSCVLEAGSFTLHRQTVEPPALLFGGFIVCGGLAYTAISYLYLVISGLCPSTRQVGTHSHKSASRSKVFWRVSKYSFIFNTVQSEAQNPRC